MIIQNNKLIESGNFCGSILFCGLFSGFEISCFVLWAHRFAMLFYPTLFVWLSYAGCVIVFYSGLMLAGRLVLGCAPDNKWHAIICASPRHSELGLRIDVLWGMRSERFSLQVACIVGCSPDSPLFVHKLWLGRDGLLAARTPFYGAGAAWAGSCSQLAFSGCSVLLSADLLLGF